MKKGTGKDAVVIIDRYTKREIARYPCVVSAARDLNIPEPSIRGAIYMHSVAYECYWIYASEIKDWNPISRRQIKTRGIHISEKLESLRNNL